MSTPRPCAAGCGYMPIGHKREGWICGRCAPAAPNAWPDRYRVCSLGRAGRAALVQDLRSHKVVLTLRGVDQWELADQITALLNASRMETPIREEHP